MVADNFATPRDGALISSLDLPFTDSVRIQEGINVHYLDLIRKNKGILHSAESDVSNLHLLAENEIITIDGYSYRFAKNKFSLIK